ncbi:MAG: sigma-70 family RNA polymerase sigma factor [Halopseudomonas sp.]
MHALYRDHHSWLVRWLLGRLGCSHRAADLAQDTFMRLLAKEELPGLREPRAFLTTVAKRVMSNQRRREQLEKAYLEALTEQPEHYALSPEEQALLMEALVEIDQLLDGLPGVVRRAFLHVQLDGMGHAEVASLLNISISTVKRYLRRAALRCYFGLDTQ